jgi:hypothetical protein
MGLDTKTYWLTDRQSQCDFDFDFELEESVIVAGSRSSKKNQEVLVSYS